MSLGRMTMRFSRAALTRCRSSSERFHPLTNQLLISPCRPDDKVLTASTLHNSALNSLAFQRFGFSSPSSPEANKKEAAQSRNAQENKGNKEAADDAPNQNEATVSEEKVEPGSAAETNSDTTGNAKRRRRGAKQAQSSDSDSDTEGELSRDDLVKLVVEKDELLETKQEELERMKDKVLRTFAEMENVKERTRRESENAKKFAIQNFAKSLLDVADNLGRASTAAKESFSNIDASKDTTGAVQQLKTLLEGVEMTEKQLTEVFRKFGLEKYDPVNEEFDPNRHNAVFQVPDASKPAGHVGVVLKAGYILHDRVIRPAEVGVTVAVDNDNE